MVGSYMGRVFTVSSQRILTPSNLKGSAGSYNGCCTAQCTGYR